MSCKYSNTFVIVHVLQIVNILIKKKKVDTIQFVCIFNTSPNPYQTNIFF